jgi:hypothetical protein
MKYSDADGPSVRTESGMVTVLVPAEAKAVASTITELFNALRSSAFKAPLGTPEEDHCSPTMPPAVAENAPDGFNNEMVGAVVMVKLALSIASKPVCVGVRRRKNVDRAVAERDAAVNCAFKVTRAIPLVMDASLVGIVTTWPDARLIKARVYLMEVSAVAFMSIHCMVTLALTR